MKTNTSQKIIDLIKEKGQIRPHDLSKALLMSSVAVHKQLKKLIVAKKILKIGKPPKVFYTIPKEPSILLGSGSDVPAEKSTLDLIEKTYLYITPTGEMLYGLQGFIEWVNQIKLTKQLLPLMEEYVKIRNEADTWIKDDGWIDATEKIQNAFFEPIEIDTVFYQDFYALPKFGKTLLGQWVLHAKQAQSRELISHIALRAQPILSKIVQDFNISAIGYIPHSIPRQVPFLTELKKTLQLSLPLIELTKAYSGEIIVAQKSLSKIEERIVNAKETIFVVEPIIPYENILLIDDAVGSGATFVETAKKIKHHHPMVKKIYAFAIVGSMKGFEVIREV